MTSTPPAWARRWIGLPYRWGGDPGQGYDCWSYAVAIWRAEAGIAPTDPGTDGLPNPPAADAPDAAWVAWRAALAAAIEANRSAAEWRELGREERAAEFDGVLIRRGVKPCHVGVLCAAGRRGRGWVLHIEEATGSVLSPLDGPDLAHHVVGLFRHRDLEARARAAA